jgi:hypothetical protein
MGRPAARWATKTAAALFTAALLGSRLLSAEAGREVVLRGTVKDQAGAPLAGYPIRLIKTKTILNLLHFSTGSQQQEGARTQTSASGEFEMRVVPDPKYDYFYLRFYDAASFDPVRYQVPGDKDVTRPLKSGTEVVVEEVIQDNPDWSRVEAMLKEFGAESNRGRILRALGLPERRETVAGSPGRENWWYYTKGICYQLQSDEVLKIRRYDPVIPPRPAT